MCGISGGVADNGIEIDRMIESIRHRGPDHQAIFKEKHVSLAHARLSIIDLSKLANQPMRSASKRFVIVYNGEVYNYKDLRKELETVRGEFKSNSDTEVVVESFEYWGVDSFERLNGMFAFAIFDRQKEQIYLVRDRFGIKPLYFWFGPAKSFLFGSEIKTLLCSGLVEKKINYHGLYEYLHYSTTLGESTFYRGIKKLLPGHYLKFDISKKEYSIQPYHLNYKTTPSDVSSEFAIQKIRHLFEESVRKQLVADVPVGVFLSGGVDSSAIAIFAAKHYNGQLKTFSAGFDYDKGINELQNAQIVAKKIGSEHHEFNIRGQDVPDVLERLNTYFDQPFGDAANIPLFLMSRELKGHHKVVLQGDGGDELFAGYFRYRRLKYYNFFKIISKLVTVSSFLVPTRSSFYRKARYFKALGQKDSDKEMAFIMSQEMPDEDPKDYFSKFIKMNLSRINPFERYQYFYEILKNNNPVQRMLFTDMNIVLPDLYFEKVDRSTMANGIEIRVPFLDNELVSFVMSLPAEYKVKGKQKKYLLKRAFKGIVPDQILYGPKQGFGVPFQFWLKKSMKDFMYDSVRSAGISNKKLELAMDDHVRGKKDNGYLLWKMLNLSLWINSDYGVRL